MTQMTAPHAPITAEAFADEIRNYLLTEQGVTPQEATVKDVYVATAKATHNHLVPAWAKTRADMVKGNTKAVGYLSAEFLLGRQLRNSLLDAGLSEQFSKAMAELGFDANEVVFSEPEPGLGNGGLGRLAACFVDSLASLGVPPSVMASSTSTASSVRNSMIRAASTSGPIIG